MSERVCFKIGVFKYSGMTGPTGQDTVAIEKITCFPISKRRGILCHEGHVTKHQGQSVDKESEGE